MRSTSGRASCGGRATSSRPSTSWSTTRSRRVPSRTGGPCLCPWAAAATGWWRWIGRPARRCGGAPPSISHPARPCSSRSAARTSSWWSGSRSWWASTLVTDGACGAIRTRTSWASTSACRSGAATTPCSSRPATTAGSRLIRLSQVDGRTTPEERWFNNRMRVHFGNALRIDGLVIASTGRLRSGVPGRARRRDRCRGVAGTHLPPGADAGGRRPPRHPRRGRGVGRGLGHPGRPAGARACPRADLERLDPAHPSWAARCTCATGTGYWPSISATRALRRPGPR